MPDDLRAADPQNAAEVTFLPQNQTVGVQKGATLYDAAIKAGVIIDALCGGNGSCGKCKMILFPQGTEVLACKYTVHENIFAKTVPEDFSVMVREYRGISEKAYEESDRVFRKIPLTLSPPTKDDNRDDYSRITDLLKQYFPDTKISLPIEIMRTIPGYLRENCWKISVIVMHDEGKVTVIHAGDDINYCLAAIDFGTTTLQASLLDGDSGQKICESSMLSRQIVFGADIITRIISARKKLHECSMSGISSINELLKAMNAGKPEIYGIILSGNTAMTHILYGLTPEFIRKEPYIPAQNAFEPAECQKFGIGEKAVMMSVPGISSYVGGDIVSGIISTGIYKKKVPCFLMDLGTNGEIALGCGDFMISCACSAGPAFEGGGIKCGKRAAGGAISKAVYHSGKISLTTIDNKEPNGICGSGIISLVSSLFTAGIIDKRGKFAESSHLVTLEEGNKKIVLYKNKKSEIFLDEHDIENLLRAKAAMFSGCEILLEYMGLSFNDVDRFFISGGISQSLDIEACIDIGLLPEIDTEKYTACGNTSLTGAEKIIMSQKLRQKALAIAKETMYLDLSIIPQFSDRWTAALFLPHTDLSKFSKRTGVISN